MQANASGWLQQGGTFNGDAGAPVHVYGDFIVEGGTYNCSEKLKPRTGGNLVRAAAGTLNCPAGILALEETGDITLDINGQGFRIMETSRTPVANVTIIGTARVGWFRLAWGSINGGNLDIFAEGITATEMNGGTGTVRFVDDATTSLTGNVGETLILPNVEIARSGTTKEVSLNSTILVQKLTSCDNR